MSDTPKPDDERLHEGLEIEIIPPDEVTEEELFNEAKELFDVKSTEDDDLILKK
jgi:hypothetical protein